MHWWQIMLTICGPIGTAAAGVSFIIFTHNRTNSDWRYHRKEIQRLKVEEAIELRGIAELKYAKQLKMLEGAGIDKDELDGRRKRD